MTPKFQKWLEILKEKFNFKKLRKKTKFYKLYFNNWPKNSN